MLFNSLQLLQESTVFRNKLSQGKDVKGYAFSNFVKTKYRAVDW